MKLVELQAEAAKFGIIVNEVDGGFELEAPAGMQFSEELHFLVNLPNVIRSAIRDVKENGPRLQKCPDDCPCKQAAENDETDLRICDCGATAEGYAAALPPGPLSAEQLHHAEAWLATFHEALALAGGKRSQSRAGRLAAFHAAPCSGLVEPVHIISLGAGVQSSTMALMAACGEITPMPIAAVFADTHAEPAGVYEWLDWLETKLPFPVIRVSKGDMTAASLNVRTKKDGSGKWAKSLIPAHVLNKDGSKGIMGRACTFDYKVMELEKASKRLGNIKRNQKTVGVVQWIGISLDEAHRMKPARKPWVTHRWPLIDLRMKRHDCLRWMEAKGYPTPPRSACIYCPFHSDAEWRRLRDEEPKEFQKAVKFESDLQHAKRQTDNMGGIPFLHASLKPLGEVDFSTDIERGQGDLFGNDCTGLCGV